MYKFLKYENNSIKEGRKIALINAMKKKSYLIAMALIAVLLVLFGVLLVAGSWKRNHPDEYRQETQPVVDYGVSANEGAAGDIQRQAYGANIQQTASSETYYLILQENKVSIYRDEGHIFYDYADVNLDTMPIEILEQLKLGLYIAGEDELYDFLQTYSS